ncbi:hypothetical protein HPB49_005745 [Dermacentor silvarum]|uniref:Uncharacterized protein n=1 Tax=Dermacentor silvarum TaxID=543639 RepID=A0ACB8DVT9_DERSI|nr:hypothetical protein HPB49_005745 [Dermacentor silvarum]
MELRGKQHPFNVYVADPDDSYKGVVHGFPAHTESADLHQHLRVRTQGVTIERARMLGSSNTALLTFSGGTRPKCVYYMGVEMRCTEYRPTVQMCLECMQEGHRSDVCPNPKNICRGCGLENPPPQGHECEVPRRPAHGARDPSVPEQTDCRQSVRKTTRQSRSRERLEQRTKKAPGRWFESTEEEDFYRRRSRSRSPQGGTAKSSTPSRDPSSSRASQRSNSPLPKKQQSHTEDFRQLSNIFFQKTYLLSRYLDGAVSPPKLSEIQNGKKPRVRLQRAIYSFGWAVWGIPPPLPPEPPLREGVYQDGIGKGGLLRTGPGKSVAVGYRPARALPLARPFTRHPRATLQYSRFAFRMFLFSLPHGSCTHTRPTPQGHARGKFPHSEKWAHAAGGFAMERHRMNFGGGVCGGTRTAPSLPGSVAAPARFPGGLAWLNEASSFQVSLCRRDPTDGVERNGSSDKLVQRNDVPRHAT